MRHTLFILFFLCTFNAIAQINQDVPKWFTHPAKGEYVGVSLPLVTVQGDSQILREKSAEFSAILSYFICMKKQRVKEDKSKVAFDFSNGIFEYELYLPEITNSSKVCGSMKSFCNSVLFQKSDVLQTQMIGEGDFFLEGKYQVVRKQEGIDGTIWVALRFNPEGDKSFFTGKLRFSKNTINNISEKVSNFQILDPVSKIIANIDYEESMGTTSLSVEYEGVNVNGHYVNDNIKNTALNSKYLQTFLGSKELNTIGYDNRGISTSYGIIDPQGVGYFLSLITLIEDNVIKTSLEESTDLECLYNVGNYFQSGYTQSYFMPIITEDKPKYMVAIESHKENNTFAVIFGNEKYLQAEDVPYAQNDAKAFAEYCQRVLNIPEKQISIYENATYGSMRTAIKRLKETVNAFQGDVDIVFYYAGHGFPDEESQNAYLLPSDADGTMPEVCYSLNQLYSELGSMNARKIIVFMDACFSGSKRSGGMLQSARGIAIKAKPSELKGNLVVFSAATGEQTAFPYHSEEHGLFTYYLLRKLQMDNGEMTLGALVEYVKNEVGKTSIIENKKTQTPTVTFSSELKDRWKDLKLK